MKDFIPYEEALELKQLEFDEPCFATYIGETFDSSVQFQSDDYFTAAPLFSQAFRFFREKYNLDSYITQIEINGKSYWKIRKIETNDFVKGYSLFHDTYEEAELACLRKLIEIVKQKQ